jgi:hypothetical protein
MTYRYTLILGAWVVLISIIAEAIGTLKFQAGPGMIILFPLIWAILLGAIISVQKVRPMSYDIQRMSARVLEVGIMIFIVRLGTLIGPHIGDLYRVGWALSFQELGHVFGTVVIALPIAVWLGMGRASIGATYSIDREPNLAFMAERFGGDSDEYRGALAIYVLGSIVGALYIALLAGFLGGMHIFDPIALAMGSGVGSGSMMAAASSAIAAEFPAYKSQILAVAGASNLITEVIGVYVTVFISLPLAMRLYRFWQRVFGREIAATPAAAQYGMGSTEPEPQQADDSGHGKDSITWMVLTSLLIGVVMIVSNFINNGHFSGSLVLGMVIMIAITVISFLIKRFIPQIPVIVWASLAGIVLTAGHTSVASAITSLVGHIDFLAIVRPVLAYAGLSLGKDLPMLRRLGLRFILVALVVYTTTFLAASAIAEILL